MTTADEKSPLLCAKQNIPELESGGLPKQKLERTIGILSASAIVFGNCVGAGIFISPRGVYEQTGSGGAGLLVWALAGTIATLCTYAYAELGCMMPESGGEFVYIKRAFGELPAFLFSFCYAFLIRPAGITVVSITLAEYSISLVWKGEPLSPMMIKAVATSFVLLVAVVCCLSSKALIKFCNVTSFIKLILVGFLLVCGLAIVIKGEGRLDNFRSDTAFIGSSPNPVSYGLAFYFCMFSFQSWNSLNYMTEELKTPNRTLPFGGIMGLLAVATSYILANISYLMILDFAEIVESTTIGMDCGRISFGKVGEVIMCIGLCVSCLGCLAGVMLCISRNIQSTAEQGVFPGWMAYVNPTVNTPIAGILVFVVFVLAYLAVDVNILIQCLGTVEWLFYALTFAAFIYLRHKEPDTHRPIKVPVFIAIILFFTTSTFVVLPLFSASSRTTGIIGLCALPFGAVFYYAQHFYKRWIDEPKEGFQKNLFEFHNHKRINTSESSDDDRYQGKTEMVYR